MPVKIGITGGIGSGKSVVCRLLQAMGVPVYISDTESKRLMQSDEEIRRRLTELLGAEAYTPDGLPNKPVLAAYLFASPDNAARINAIVHPRVKADFRRWVARHAHAPLVAMESAILIEAGFAPEVDSVVMVYAPLETRIARAMQRDAAPRSAVESRVRSQMDDEEKRLQAHHVLLNDGKTPLIPQVLSLIALLTKNNVLPLPPVCGQSATDKSES